jgi:hypothetical protein
MAELGVKKPVQGPTRQHDTSANPGPDRDVADGFQTLRGTPAVLTERRCVHVGVEGDGNAQPAAELLPDIGVRPSRLGGGGDVPPRGGRPVLVDRSEGADPDRIHRALTFEEGGCPTKRLVGGRRRNRLGRRQIVGASPDRTLPFRSAGLDSAEDRHARVATRSCPGTIRGSSPRQPHDSR